MCMKYLKTRSTKESIENLMDSNDQEAEGDDGLMPDRGFSKDEAYLLQNERSSESRNNNMECQIPSENNIN